MSLLICNRVAWKPELKISSMGSDTCVHVEVESDNDIGEHQKACTDLLLSYLHHFMKYILLSNLHMNKISTIFNQGLEQLKENEKQLQ